MGIDVSELKDGFAVFYYLMLKMHLYAYHHSHFYSGIIQQKGGETMRAMNSAEMMQANGGKKYQYKCSDCPMKYRTKFSFQVHNALAHFFTAHYIPLN